MIFAKFSFRGIIEDFYSVYRSKYASEELHHNTVWIQQLNPPIVSQFTIFVKGLTRLSFMRGSDSCPGWFRASQEKRWSEVKL